MAAEDMAESDHELFIEMLVKLDGTHESVKAASKWCRANAQHHDVIVKTWFWAVAKSRTMNRRLDLFHLASDILFTADSQSLPFFCSFLPILVKAIPLVRGEEIKLSMSKLLSLWREKNIYNEDVMDELEKSLRNRNKVVDDDVFYYDQDLLIANSKRIYKLKPAVDFLSSEVNNSQTFDNIQVLLGNIKDRRTCASLFRAVDNQKKRVKTLVDFLEEMVHLLKMTTGDLDMAANREQNGVEKVKLKLMGYERFGQKVRSVQDTLISVHHVPPPAIRSPDRVNELLFVRRPATKNPEALPTFSPEHRVPMVGSTTPLREMNFVEPNFMLPPPMGGFFTPAVNVINPLFPPQIPYAAQLVSGRESYEPVGSLTPLRDEAFVLPMETRRYSYPVGLGTPRHDTWAGSSTPVADDTDIPIGSLTPRINSFEKLPGSLTPRNDEYDMPRGSEGYSGPSSVPIAPDPRMRRSMPVYATAGSYDPPSGASTPRHDSFSNDLPILRRPAPDTYEFPVVDRRRASTPGRERAMSPGRDMSERGRTSGRDFSVQDKSRAVTPRRDRSVSREERGRTPGREFPVHDRSRAMTPGRERGRTPVLDFPMQDRSRAMTPGRESFAREERGRTPGRDFPMQNRQRAMTPGRDVGPDGEAIFSRRDRGRTPGRDHSLSRGDRGWTPGGDDRGRALTLGRERAMTQGRGHAGPDGEIFTRRDRGRTPIPDFPMQDRSRAMTPGRDCSIGPGGERGRTPARDFPLQDRSRAMTPGRDRSIPPGGERGRTPGRDFPMQDRSRAMTPGRDRSIPPGRERGRTPGRDFPMQDRSRAMTPGRDRSIPPGRERGRTPGRDFPMQDRTRAMTPGRDRSIPPGGERGITPGRNFPMQDRSRAMTPGRDHSVGRGNNRARIPGQKFPSQDRSRAMTPARDPRKFNPQDRSRAITPGRDCVAGPTNDPRVARGRHPNASEGDSSQTSSLDKSGVTPSKDPAPKLVSDVIPGKNPAPNQESGVTFAENPAHKQKSGETSGINPARRPETDAIASNNSASKQESGVSSGKNSAPKQESGVTTGKDSALKQVSGMTPGKNAAPEQESGTTCAKNPAPKQESGVTPGKNSAPKQESGVTRAENPAPKQKSGVTSGTPQTGVTASNNPASKQGSGVSSAKNPSPDQGTTSKSESPQPDSSKVASGNDQAKATDHQMSREHDGDNLSTSSDGELPSSKESDGVETPETELAAKNRVVTPEKVAAALAARKDTGTILRGKSTAPVSTTEKEDTSKTKQAFGTSKANAGKPDSSSKTGTFLKKDLVKVGGNQTTAQNKTIAPAKTLAANRTRTFRGRGGTSTQRAKTSGREFNPGDRFATKSYPNNSGQGRGKFKPRVKSNRPILPQDKHGAKGKTIWKRVAEHSIQSEGYSNQQQTNFQARRNSGQQNQRPGSRQGPNPGRHDEELREEMILFQERQRVRVRERYRAGSSPDPWEPFEPRNSLPAIINAAIHDNSQGESIFEKIRTTVIDRARAMTPSRDTSTPSRSRSMSPRHEGSFSPSRETSWGSFWGSGNTNRPVYQPTYTGLTASTVRSENQIRPLLSKFPHKNDNRPQGGSSFMGYTPSDYR